MKKLIIALSALAIANFNFITPVKAQLVNEDEMYNAKQYALRAEKEERNIYTGYDVENVVFFLAEQSCKEKDFGKALEVLKYTNRKTFIATVLMYNDVPDFKMLIQSLTEKACPEIRVQF
jgi:hypothetical protein